MQMREHEVRHGPVPGLEGRLDDLRRIAVALQNAALLCRSFACQAVRVERKDSGDPVTTVDRAVNDYLSETLPRGREGWLSEESADNPQRLSRRRVWVVDPLDGTKEFLAGLPEWSVSIALVEEGQPVAGGICNPTTGEIFTGSRETGIHSCLPEGKTRPFVRGRKPYVLASRSEVQRGEWDWLKEAPFEVLPVGSIAYKLALVAAGRADATWTFVPKSEWDIAAGVALVLSSGGKVRGLNGKPITFNQQETIWDGLVALASHVGTRQAHDFESYFRQRGSRGIQL